MNRLLFIAAILMVVSCGETTAEQEATIEQTTDSVTSEQADSLEKVHEEEEMAEEIIEGSFDALNR